MPTLKLCRIRYWRTSGLARSSATSTLDRGLPLGKLLSIFHWKPLTAGLISNSGIATWWALRWMSFKTQGHVAFELQTHVPCSLCSLFLVSCTQWSNGVMLLPYNTCIRSSRNILCWKKAVTHAFYNAPQNLTTAWWDRRSSDVL